MPGEGCRERGVSSVKLKLLLEKTTDAIVTCEWSSVSDVIVQKGPFGPFWSESRFESAQVRMVHKDKNFTNHIAPNYFVSFIEK